MGYKSDCTWFTGYKPCKFNNNCDGCTKYLPPEHRLAVVSLEAMGAVLRSTCLLPAIKRKYPNSHITWITYSSAKPLLAENPMIDRLVVADDKTSALLQYLKFDIVFGVDKSMEAGALVETIKAEKKVGFGLEENGAIRPLSDAANYQFEVGLNDQLKFYDNEKPETQQLTESMELSWERDPYVFQFTEKEIETSKFRRDSLISEAEKNTKNTNIQGVIGYNTGCSLLYPNKKLTIEKSVELIKSWREILPNHMVILLGGREDEARHKEVIKEFHSDDLVVTTPTDEGLRSGIMWVECADLVFSGCSLGMHIAIALQKKVVAWYGVSCHQEVDLYDKGAKIISEMACSPCWKKTCGNDPMCYDNVNVTDIVTQTKALLS